MNARMNVETAAHMKQQIAIARRMVKIVCRSDVMIHDRRGRLTIKGRLGLSRRGLVPVATQSAKSLIFRNIFIQEQIPITIIIKY